MGYLAINGVALTPPHSMIGIAAPALVIFFRMLQGFALGGEFGTMTTAFLMEAAPVERRGILDGVPAVVSTASGASFPTCGICAREHPECAAIARLRLAHRLSVGCRDCPVRLDVTPQFA